MSLLKWDQIGEKRYETGTDHGVLYPQKAGAYPEGIAWSGLTGVTESPSGAESTKQYADNIAYLDLTSAEEFGATIECYSYPDEFNQCNGIEQPVAGLQIGQQNRNTFGFSYRSKVGNDTEGDSYGYKLHLIYGAKASPSERSYTTVNESPEAMTLSFEVTTTPVSVSGVNAEGKPYKPTAIITIDSTQADPEKLAALEEILYGKEADGTEGSEPVKARLPLPDEVISLMSAG